MIHKFLRGSAIFFIAVALFSLAAFFSKPQTASAASISSSTWYTVVNQNSGKCVDDAAGGTANGTSVQQWACVSGSTNQQWQFTPNFSGNGYYSVASKNSAEVWDVTGPSTANGALIHLWAYGGGLTSQEWLPVALDSTHYKFVNLNSGSCLDVPAASTADGVQLQQYTCNGTAAQSWTLNAIGGTPTNTPTFVPATPPPGGNGTPFSGSPYSIPGKVQAENYNLGGVGVGYQFTTSGTSGTSYRSDSAKNIEATTDTGGGFDVGWTTTGDWMKYTVNVTTAGTYSIDFRVASAQNGSGLHLEVDGNNVTADMVVPNTGGWQTWTDMVKQGVSLSAGTHILRVVIETGGMNINWFNIFAGNPTATPIPNGSGFTVCGVNFCKNGSVYRFHGMDRAGLEFGCSDSMTQTDFNNMRNNWNANVVRLALSQDNWLSNCNGYQNNVASEYNMATNAGLNVIFDLHWNQGGQQLMADTNSVTFWKQMANVYKNDSNVIFELYNEPELISASCWRYGGSGCPAVGNQQMVGMQTLADAIRGQGANNLLLAGGVNWAYDFSALTSVLPLPEANVGYTTHPYWNYSGKMAGNWAANWGFMLSNYPVIATEFGNTAACDPSGYSAFMNYVQSHSNLSFSGLGMEFARHL